MEAETSLEHSSVLSITEMLVLREFDVFISRFVVGCVTKISPPAKKDKQGNRHFFASKYCVLVLFM